MAAENTPEQLISHARDLVAEFQSVLMATSSVDGVPEVSYSPHVIIDGLLYVFLSDLSVHTGNLKANPRASLLFIEDEAGCGNLHARRRVTYRVSAEKLARDDPRFEPVLAAMQVSDHHCAHRCDAVTP